MLTRLIQCDVTGTVNLADPPAVSDAVCAILKQRYGHFDAGTLRHGFSDIKDAFWGRYPGLLPCDTPYHDLRHSLGTALLMARMVDGYQSGHGTNAPDLNADDAVLAIMLALYHDIGFLRRESEVHLCGACLINDHEQRGVDFMRRYLAQGAFTRFADQAELIHATNFAKPISETLAGRPREFYLIGQMLGTADLISQLSGRYYLERCRYYLYQEFVDAGADRSIGPNGETLMLYASPEDLLRKTPSFYEHLVRKRLDEDFDKVYRNIAYHFGGDDPYTRGVQRNLDYLRQLIASNDFTGLRRKPVPVIPSVRELETHN
ncbi:HD domain-containing protein [Denitratisoma oestradiolicum]|uniref:HD/PDEase domain-containing protein n=1 Tax=Denitratisoma oestradiolicum TaxID=311182 RepID=A0A6S6XWH5_9PROT|nr:HD domain-containing protein [Denitratisoma oestradiolicum]TWO80212.1 hypothetical protein CBW56_10360 [Denitratisoma oestradiolicum]CAB1369294.1 conserved protein of unknown function [Denitratisoma oestradiolicum]